MKGLFAMLLFTSISVSTKAQIVFRNVGRDTIRIAVGIFYDTTRKAMLQYYKPVIVRGWYKILPGDSVSVGTVFGPAVYYLPEIIKSNRYVIGDTLVEADKEKRADYRESLFIQQHHYRDGYADIKDSSMFSIKHPVNDPGIYVTAPFRVVLVTEEVRRKGRLVIALGKSTKG